MVTSVKPFKVTNVKIDLGNARSDYKNRRFTKNDVYDVLFIYEGEEELTFAVSDDNRRLTFLLDYEFEVVIGE